MTPGKYKTIKGLVFFGYFLYFLFAFQFFDANSSVAVTDVLFAITPAYAVIAGAYLWFQLKYLKEYRFIHIAASIYLITSIIFALLFLTFILLPMFAFHKK